MSDVYTPIPVTTPPAATTAQALEFYRTEFSRIVGESLRLKAENNQLRYALEEAQKGIAIEVHHVGDEQLPITAAAGAADQLREGEVRGGS